MVTPTAPSSVSTTSGPDFSFPVMPESSSPFPQAELNQRRLTLLPDPVHLYDINAAACYSLAHTPFGTLYMNHAGGLLSVFRRSMTLLNQTSFYPETDCIRRVCYYNNCVFLLSFGVVKVFNMDISECVARWRVPYNAISITVVNEVVYLTMQNGNIILKYSLNGSSRGYIRLERRPHPAPIIKAFQNSMLVMCSNRGLSLHDVKHNQWSTVWEIDVQLDGQLLAVDNSSRLIWVKLQQESTMIALFITGLCL